LRSAKSSDDRWAIRLSRRLEKQIEPHRNALRNLIGPQPNAD
jgi:hypothetical protein